MICGKRGFINRFGNFNFKLTDLHVVGVLVIERGVEDDLLSWLCRNIAGWNLCHVDRRDWLFAS